MDNSTKEEMLRRLQLRINEAKHLNNLAAQDEIAEEHQMKKEDVTQDNIFDIPSTLLKRNSQRNGGPTSEDHINDPDVAYYLREIRKVPKSVYQDYQDRRKRGEPAAAGWRPRPEVVSAFANRLEARREKMQERNRRTANYDISGKYRVDFINDKNKRFNRKLAREFNEFTEDIRINLERGGNV